MNNDIEVPVPTEIQQAAGLIVQTSSKISTVDLLVAHRLDKSVPRYKQASELRRRQWLYRQIGGVFVLSGSKLPKWETLTLDADVLDSAIMENTAMANLTALEIQDAFRLGVTGAFGDYYGINPKSLMGFLQGYLDSEKKRAAHRFINAREEKADKEADERLYQEIQDAKRNGTFSPTWGPSFNFGQKVKAEDSEAHRAKIKEQADQIYKTL